MGKHTSWIRVDLPVSMKRSAAKHEVHDHGQVADNDEDVADADADSVVPVQTSLQSAVSSHSMP